MPNYISLDQEDSEIKEEIQSDYTFQRESREIENNAVINLEIANEIMSTLQQIENQYWDSVDNQKFRNLETDSVPYEELRQWGNLEIPRLIKNKRRYDLMQWGRIATSRDDRIARGARLIFNDPDHSVTKREKIELREWELKLFNKLFYAPHDSRPNFSKFIGTAYDDFFDLDDIAFEYRTNGLGKTIAVHLTDPIIWKPVIKERKYEDSIGDDLTEIIDDFEKIFDIKSYRSQTEDVPDYLLVYRGHKFAGVNRDIVRKFHYFTQSDFKRSGRGLSIVEQSLRLIGYITSALRMNSSNFTNSRLPSGFFLFTGGGVNQMLLEKLKKQLWANMNGAGNQSRFPMLSLRAEKADGKWVGVRNNSRDMEYHQFMTLLLSIFCMYSGTDPRELSLGSYSDAVGKRSLFEEPTDGIVKESKDVGIRSFLKHLEDALNSNDRYGKNIFQTITKMDVRLSFVGFEVEDRKQKLEIQSKELSTTKSVNDLLVEAGLEKARLDVGGKNIYDIKAISNPQIWQAIMVGMQQQQQPEMPGGDAGEAGEGETESQQEQRGLTENDKNLLRQFRDIADVDESIREELENEF